MDISFLSARKVTLYGTLQLLYTYVVHVRSFDSGVCSS